MATVSFVGLTHHLKLMGLRPHYFKLDFSPIVYYTSGKDCSEWVLFLHAAFVNHKMFQPQIKYFENKSNILAVDIIGHGNSTDTNDVKGFCFY